MHGYGFVREAACSDVVGLEQYTFNTLQMGGAFSTHAWGVFAKHIVDRDVLCPR